MKAKNLSININDLTIENIGIWPLPIKIAAVALVCILLSFFAYWFDTRKQIAQLSSGEQFEQKLKEEFRTKYAQVSNLEAYKIQLTQIKMLLNSLLRQLPSEAEIPNLLEDISKAGVGSGLEFTLFAPQQEILHDFYAELPIKIIVVGSYQQLGNFVSKIASLGRIVTIHDYKLTPHSAAKTDTQKSSVKDSPRKSKPDDLTMELTAKTYRYLEMIENSSVAPPAGGQP